jgi:hypothetical protein
MSSKVGYKDSITVFNAREKPTKKAHDKSAFRFVDFNTSLQLSKIIQSNRQHDASNVDDELEQKKESKKKRVKTSHCVEQKKPPLFEHILNFDTTHEGRVLDQQEQKETKLETEPSPKAKQVVIEAAEQEEEQEEEEEQGRSL